MNLFLIVALVTYVSLVATFTIISLIRSFFLLSCRNLNQVKCLWSLPGGWVNVLESIESNTIKEVKEESGLDVITKRIIAIQDRNKHNKPLYPYGVCKVFVECEFIGVEFIKNIETTSKQIEMCFEAKDNPNWKVVFD